MPSTAFTLHHHARGCLLNYYHLTHKINSSTLPYYFEYTNFFNRHIGLLKIYTLACRNDGRQNLQEQSSRCRISGCVAAKNYEREKGTSGRSYLDDKMPQELNLRIKIKVSLVRNELEILIHQDGSFISYNPMREIRNNTPQGNPVQIRKIKIKKL